MTRFALLIWAYKQTGSATSVALLGFAAFLPMILISPFAGVWIDRFDRRKILMLSDLGAGLMTVGRLVFALGMTTYILIGLHFEERDLLRRFGDQYRAYQVKTPMLIPGLQLGKPSSSLASQSGD